MEQSPDQHGMQVLTLFFSSIENEGEQDTKFNIKISENDEEEEDGTKIRFQMKDEGEEDDKSGMISIPINPDADGKPLNPLLTEICFCTVLLEPT